MATPDFSGVAADDLHLQAMGELIGAQSNVLGGWLEPIQSHCLIEGLPALTVLVVSGSDGVPGSGFIAAVNVPREQTKVFNHDWVSTPIPSAAELARAVAQRPSNGVRIDG